MLNQNCVSGTGLAPQKYFRNHCRAKLSVISRSTCDLYNGKGGTIWEIVPPLPAEL